MLRDYLIAVLRTGITLLIGQAAAWLADLGFELSAATQAELGLALSFALYAGIAALERKWPKFGWLLGWGKGAGPSFETDKAKQVSAE